MRKQRKNTKSHAPTAGSNATTTTAMPEISTPPFRSWDEVRDLWEKKYQFNRSTLDLDEAEAWKRADLEMRAIILADQAPALGMPTSLFSWQTLKDLWEKKYQFNRSTLDLDEIKAAEWADRTIRITFIHQQAT